MQEISADSHPDQSSIDISDDLPKNVLRILNEGSSPTSMDFHPEHQTVLLGLLIRISFHWVSYFRPLGINTLFELNVYSWKLMV
jgi:hypothetical protein